MFRADARKIIKKSDDGLTRFPVVKDGPSV